MSANINVVYEGPSRRFFIAIEAIKEGAEPKSADPWTLRLYDILKLREKYRKSKKINKFAEKWPLFNLLLKTFEATGIGNDREVLEAAIIAADDSKEISEAIGKKAFTPAFINLYKKFFYDLDDIKGNDVKFAQYVLLPLLRYDTEDLAVGAIWKLLACSGGLKMLVEKGFKSSAIRPEDIGYLLQLTCMRNCSLLLRYSSKGLTIFGEQANPQSFLLTLSDFDGIRGPERRFDGFAASKGVNRNMYNSMLNEGVKLISAPDDIADELLAADGAFHPELEEARAYVKHNLIEG